MKTERLYSVQELAELRTQRLAHVGTTVTVHREPSPPANVVLATIKVLAYDARLVGVCGSFSHLYEVWQRVSKGRLP
jgi:hypothetical protein